MQSRRPIQAETFQKLHAPFRIAPEVLEQSLSRHRFAIDRRFRKKIRNLPDRWEHTRRIRIVEPMVKPYKKRGSSIMGRASASAGWPCHHNGSGRRLTRAIGTAGGKCRRDVRPIHGEVRDQ